MAQRKSATKPANDTNIVGHADATQVSPISKELIIALVGYAGAGCSTGAKRLQLVLHAAGYEVFIVKLSELIGSYFSQEAIPVVVEGPGAGEMKLERAVFLQDLGDRLRSEAGGHALASLAVSKIIELRGSKRPGEHKVCYLVESLKHKDEVEMLRRVYDQSFRLVAVHCDRPRRQDRLIGDALAAVKYAGAAPEKVLAYMDRDEKDGLNSNGQQVRDAFYLADYFIDNSAVSTAGENLTDDVKRFAQLLLGTELVRPTLMERAMYHAHAAALQSSCLSRQVGAALVSKAGELVATGTNDVPKYGGGVYDESSAKDNRCHAWTWDSGTGITFVGCHNDRRKQSLRHDIGAWIAETMSEKLAELAHPKNATAPQLFDTDRQAAASRIRAYLTSDDAIYSNLPGVKDLIEYSRAIHAEMDALLSAAREGISPVGATLFCTTYPCHSCARHLVTAGVAHVFFIEPYVKSLASELHSDAISNLALPPKSPPNAQQQMTVTPFTGVGPRMYEDFFAKRGALKGPGGHYKKPSANVPGFAVRLRELSTVEQSAANLVKP